MNTAIKRLFLGSTFALVLLLGIGQVGALDGGSNLALTFGGMSFGKSGKDVSGARCVYGRIKNGKQTNLRVPAKALMYNIWGVKPGPGNVKCRGLRHKGYYSCFSDPVTAMHKWMKMVREGRYYFKKGNNTVRKISRLYVGTKFDKVMNTAQRPNSWARNVSKTMGISADKVLDSNDPATMIKLMQAVAKQEGHCNMFPYTEQEIALAAEKTFGTLDKAQLLSKLSSGDVKKNNSWFSAVRKYFSNQPAQNAYQNQSGFQQVSNQNTYAQQPQAYQAYQPYPQQPYPQQIPTYQPRLPAGAQQVGYTYVRVPLVYLRTPQQFAPTNAVGIVPTTPNAGSLQAQQSGQQAPAQKTQQASFVQTQGATVIKI